MRFRTALAAVGLGACLGLTSPAHACNPEGTSGIVPENDMYIPASEDSGNGMTEKLFNDLIKQVQDLYGPIVKSKGANLIIRGDWKDGTVNAYARKDGKNFYVQMFGGLARHATITPLAFVLVQCHEVGHHIGGAPQLSAFGNVKYSNEGQSDYWGTAKCLRRFLETYGEPDSEADTPTPAYVKEQCSKSFEHADDRGVCEKTSMAGHSLGNLFRDLRKQSKPLDFKTPDTKTVSRTYDGHPDSQCRLDTYFQASLCPVDFDKDVSDTDYNVGTCTTEKGAKVGVRPLCWFAPTPPAPPTPPTPPNPPKVLASAIIH